MDFLSESPSVVAPPAQDVCIPAGFCWPGDNGTRGGKGELTQLAQQLRQRQELNEHEEAASVLTLFKGPCNVCHRTLPRPAELAPPSDSPYNSKVPVQQSRFCSACARSTG